MSTQHAVGQIWYSEQQAGIMENFGSFWMANGKLLTKKVMPACQFSYRTYFDTF